MRETRDEMREMRDERDDRHTTQRQEKLCGGAGVPAVAMRMMSPSSVLAGSSRARPNTVSDNNNEERKKARKKEEASHQRERERERT